jgi:nucleoid-associated protein EbfC
MKNLNQMMKQAQQLQQRMAEMQEKLNQSEMTGSSGGGMVQVTMNGKGEVKSLKIDPSLVDPKEVEVLEDLIIAACNDTKSKIEQHMSEEMAKITGGLNIPGFKMPF